MATVHTSPTSSLIVVSWFSPGCKKNGKESEGKENDLPQPKPDGQRAVFPHKIQKDKPLPHLTTPKVGQPLPNAKPLPKIH